MPESALNAYQMVTHYTSQLAVRPYYYPNFTVGEAEAQRVQKLHSRGWQIQEKSKND